MLDSTFKTAIEATAVNGTITPSGVVKAASDPKNPLHAIEAFCWDDDAQAAYQHRLAVARSLIRQITYDAVDTTGHVVPISAWTHNPQTRDQGYIPVTKAQGDTKLAGEMLAMEMSRCEAAIRRAQGYAAVLDMEAELEALLAKVIGVTSAATSASAKKTPRAKRPPSRERPRRSA